MIKQEIHYGSYEYWESIGSYVKKGEKSFLKCPKTDTPLFAESQTRLDDSIEGWDIGDWEW